jgi:hypothetical protein
MAMPQFTAEAVLYQTSRHYGTGLHTVNPSAQTASPIWPATMKGEDGGPGGGGTPPKPRKLPPPKGSHGCSAWVKQSDPFAVRCLAKKILPDAYWDLLCGPAWAEMWCCLVHPRMGYISCEHKPPPTASQ